MKVKQMIVLGLVFAMLFAAAGCNRGSSGGTPELVWAFATWGTTPPDTGKVEEAINAYLENRQMKVKLLPIGIGDWSQRLNLMLASPNEPLDIFFISGLYQSALSRGQLVPLDDLLASRGQALVQAVGPAYLQAGKRDGEQFGIPSLRDMASGLGFLIAQEYVDKYSLDIGSIRRIEDITPILATIKSAEPDFFPMSMNVTFQVVRSLIFDPINDHFGVLMGNSNQITNLFESPEYRERVEFYRSWYLAGYISPDDAASNETAVSVMRAGRACAQFTANKPGIVIENELSTGRKLAYADITNAVLTTGGVQGVMWGIANNSKNPEKAMELLNLLFSDATLINLINYGIEGEHYVKNPDGTIGFPAGISPANARYNLSMDWQLGNSYLAYPWEGKPADLAVQMKAFNDRAIVSPAYGFEFDNSRSLTQIAALTAVADQYRRALETGSVDLSVLEEFNTRLYAAGLADVMAEKQRQYDAWRAGR